ncbi:DUF1707 SHOCT-like domain-containing protein [Asanoa iriomotensis]|uniref:Cell wall-active antibiotic response 4TMS protein YvqF n=1 Tax=Asanoa iriomotensis TaxID=234613 RepID=A0ABQ4C8X8_9ACTN|nr:DUF1707 domain-containing protein [Asanoa iriomotensis]GIF58886.1 hypothetical protein Air01nite_49810 [Asanoa iriomotensis]
MEDEADRVRVSDREREQVVDLLGRAAAEGRLTLDEYADRAADAHAAQTRGELAKLTDDLPVPAVPTALAPLPSQPPVRMVAVFGNESRKGHWVVPAHLRTYSVFGDCHLELQEAQLQAPLTTIEVTAVFGAATIFVPEGVEVRLTGPAVFGSKESKLRGMPRPGGPVLEVKVKVVFGSVTVRPPRKR